MKGNWPASLLKSDEATEPSAVALVQDIATIRNLQKYSRFWFLKNLESLMALRAEGLTLERTVQCGSL